MSLSLCCTHGVGVNVRCGIMWLCSGEYGQVWVDSTAIRDECDEREVS